MSLNAGTRLGSYEIVSRLGAGGMGEVYRARDSKLERDVAIKVLHDAFAKDEERLARFEREAKLLARLSHANVATLHGLEESQGRKFLVMELVEGETLAERIAKGPLALEEAIPLFLQIAEGLEAAHEKGIIHRDLKPANIKITLDGNIKILDFGLAKAFASDENVENGSAEMSQSPTLTKGTAVGAILGTPSYMSPEQARGKAVDRRTDVWAFACCLYESLTGRKAFEGETVSDTLAAVLKNEPEWERLPADAPTWLCSILERALRKDAKRRFPDIGDVRIEIEDALGQPASSIPPLVERKMAPVLLAALGAAFISGLTVWGVMSPGSAPPKPLKRLAINLPSRDRLNLSQGPVGVPLALSRDGSTLVYTGSRNGTHQLFVRRMAELETIPVPGTEGAEQPFFSPDGHWIGFYDRRDRRLRKVALSGGPPVTLCDLTDTRFRGGSWGENDVIFFGSRTGLREVPAAGGTPRPVTSLDDDRGETSHRHPHVLPGQGGVLFVSVGSPSTISVVSLSTGERRVLVEGSGNPRFASSGHLVFPREGSLLAVSFDSEGLEIAGAPVPVLAGVASLGPSALFDLADDGTIAYVPGPLQTRLAAALVRVDRAGVVAPLTETSQSYRYPRFSPDGRRLTFHIAAVGGAGSNVWSLEPSRGTLTRVTFVSGLTPIWSRDGTRIYFSSSRAGGAEEVFSKSADGSGDAEQVTFGVGGFLTSVSSDEKMMIVQRFGATGHDIGVLRLEEQELEMLLESSFNEHGGVLSPDDRWLAYVSDETGRDEVYVRPITGSGRRELASTDGGAEPVWSPTGTELFYRNGDRMMAVALSYGPDLTVARPSVLFEGQYQTGAPTTLGPNYDVSPDGKHFVMVREDETSASTEIHVGLNWFQELTRLAPAEK